MSTYPTKITTFYQNSVAIHSKMCHYFIYGGGRPKTPNIEDTTILISKMLKCVKKHAS